MTKKRSAEPCAFIPQDKPTSITEDYALVTLYRLFGLHIEPFRTETGRVAFRVYGNTEAAERRIYANTPVGCLDFIKELKLIRSLLFTTR
jgi:hypothetical protein